MHSQRHRNQQINPVSFYFCNSVRTRVNEWVSSFVTEMRSKRPVVQKFVDSVPTGTSASDTSDKAEPVGLTAPIAVAITPDCLNGHDFMTKGSQMRFF